MLNHMLKASNKTAPAAMQYISVSTYTATVAATTHNVTAPTTYNAGDLIVILIASKSNTAQTLTDSGWTTVFNDYNDDAQNTMHVAYRTAGTEPSTYGVTQANSRGLVATCVVLRNAGYRTLSSQTADGMDSINVSISTFNPATDGLIYYSALSTATDRTATPPTGYTEIAELYTNLANSQVNLQISYRVPNSSQSTSGVENLWSAEANIQSALFDFVNA